MSSLEGEGLALGRYLLFDEIASGGMASVHIGRMRGPAGFARTVAIKRLHPQFVRDRSFASMIVDEARLAARIRHPNVVSTLDVAVVDKEIFVVLEYVHGESLAVLSRAARGRNEAIPPPIAAAIVVGVLSGLQAAHEARSDAGDPLDLVHRDVSPQNVLVSELGVAQLLDFGVAKANARLHESTGDGSLKGKIAYMSPEQLQGKRLDRRADVYAASVVLWELLAGRNLFAKGDPAAVVSSVLNQTIEPPSRLSGASTPALDEIALRGLTRDREARFSTAEEMAGAIEAAVPLASTRDVARWVRSMAADALDERARLVADIERRSPAVASLPVEIDAEPAPARRGRLRIVGAAVLVAVAGVAFVIVQQRGETSDPPPPEGEPSAPSSVESAGVTVRSAASTDAVADTAAPLVSADTRPSAPPPEASSPPSGKAACFVPSNCRPPYRLSDDNKKEFKSECIPYLRCFDP